MTSVDLDLGTARRWPFCHVRRMARLAGAVLAADHPLVSRGRPGQRTSWRWKVRGEGVPGMPPRSSRKINCVGHRTLFGISWSSFHVARATAYPCSPRLPWSCCSSSSERAWIRTSRSQRSSSGRRWSALQNKLCGAVWMRSFTLHCTRIDCQSDGCCYWNDVVAYRCSSICGLRSFPA